MRGKVGKHKKTHKDTKREKEIDRHREGEREGERESDSEWEREGEADRDIKKGEKLLHNQCTYHVENEFPSPIWLLF